MRFNVVVAVLCATAVLAGPATAGFSTRASATAWCQGSQSWRTAKSSVGELVRIKGPIASIKYASSSNGQPTFINVGYPYPHPGRFTVVIWGSDRVNFPRAPERMFRRGQTICVQGIVSLYRGIPEIEAALWDSTGRLLSA